MTSVGKPAPESEGPSSEVGVLLCGYQCGYQDPKNYHYCAMWNGQVGSDPGFKHRSQQYACLGEKDRWSGPPRRVGAVYTTAHSSNRNSVRSIDRTYTFLPSSKGW